jgi:Domain of unknown function (DUF4345)
MTFVQAYLLAAGSFSVVVGVAYMIRPVEMAALAGFTLSTPTAIIDVQGFYGGQLVGLGVAILLGVRMPRFVFPALVLLVASLGGTALGRLYGIAASGSCPPLIAGLLSLEAATAIVAGVLVGRESARQPDRRLERTGV